MRNMIVFLAFITFLLLSSTPGLSLTAKVSLNHVAEKKPFVSHRKILPSPNSNSNSNNYYYDLNRNNGAFYSVSLRDSNSSPPPPPSKAPPPGHMPAANFRGPSPVKSPPPRKII